MESCLLSIQYSRADKRQVCLLPRLLKVNGIASTVQGLCTHFCKQSTTCTAGHNAAVSGTFTTHLFQTNMLGCLIVFCRSHYVDL